MAYEAVLGTSPDDSAKAYDDGRCGVLTSDVSQLHAIRLKLTKPEDHIILPDLISKEPFGPAVRQGDDQWLNIVKWTAFALVNAEELGVNSKNIDDALKSNKPAVQRLVGKDGDYGVRMGLTPDWAARIIRLVGNYGEIYDRRQGRRPLRRHIFVDARHRFGYTVGANFAHVKDAIARVLLTAERVRRPRAERYTPRPGGFGHHVAGTTTGPGGAFPGLGQAGAGNARGTTRGLSPPVGRSLLDPASCRVPGNLA